MEGELSMRVNKNKGLNKGHRADVAGRHAVALGLAIVSFAASERAAADCTPRSPVNDNPNVTCTGTTSNENQDPVFGKVGYGTRDDTGNTITVQSGASV